MFLDQFLFELSCKNTHTEIDSDEYSMSAPCFENLAPHEYLQRIIAIKYRKCDFFCVR